MRGARGLIWSLFICLAAAFALAALAIYLGRNKLMLTGLFARLALSTGAPQWLLKVGSIILLIGAAVLIWNLWLADHDEDVIDKHEQGVEFTVQTEGRKADQNMMERKAADDAAIDQQRKEFDNATAHLPKSGLTPRQRIDACNQLRRQGTDQAVLARARCL